MTEKHDFQKTHPESTSRYLMSYRLNRQAGQHLHALTGRKQTYSPRDLKAMRQGQHRILLQNQEALLCHRQTLRSGVYRLKDHIAMLQDWVESLSPTSDPDINCVKEVKETLSEARQQVNASNLYLKQLVDAIDQRHEQLLARYSESIHSITDRLVQAIAETTQELLGAPLSSNERDVLFGHHADTILDLQTLCQERGINESELPAKWSDAAENIDDWMLIKAYLSCKSASSLSAKGVTPAIKALKKPIKLLKKETENLRLELKNTVQSIGNDQGLRDYLRKVEGIQGGITLAEHALTNIPRKVEAPSPEPSSSASKRFSFDGGGDAGTKPEDDKPLRSEALLGSSGGQ